MFKLYICTHKSHTPQLPFLGTFDYELFSNHTLPWVYSRKIFFFFFDKFDLVSHHHIFVIQFYNITRKTNFSGSKKKNELKIKRFCFDEEDFRSNLHLFENTNTTFFCKFRLFCTFQPINGTHLGHIIFTWSFQIPKPSANSRNWTKRSCIWNPKSRRLLIFTIYDSEMAIRKYIFIISANNVNKTRAHADAMHKICLFRIWSSCSVNKWVQKRKPNGLMNRTQHLSD